MLTALLRSPAVDRPLDLEQGIDAAHDLDRDGRERDRLLARCLPPGILREIGHGEERAPGVNPAPCFQNPPRTSPSVQRHSELTPFRHEELTPMPFALQAVAG